MKKRYVERDTEGKISVIFGVQQTPPLEVLEPDDPEIVRLEAVRAWESAMKETDYFISSATEDTYDAMSAEDQAKLPQETKDKIAAKKTLRGQNP